jgi:signal transduction histidine kinase
MNYIYNSNINPEAIFVKDYSKSDSYIYGELSRAINQVHFHILNDTDSIKPEPEYLYHITDGTITKRNEYLDKILEHKDYLYKYSGSTWEYGENAYKNIQNHVMDKYTLHLVFPEEYLQQKQKEWDIERDKLIPIALTLIIAVIVGIICVIYLIVVTGRRPEDDEVHLTPYMDRIYSDIQLGIMLFTLYMWLYGIASLFRHYSIDSSRGVLSMNQYYILTMTGILAILGSIICGVILLSLVRKIKAKRLLKHSLIYAVFAGISRFIRSFFDDSRFEHFPLTKSLNRRQAIFTAASAGMVFLLLLFWAATQNFFAGLIPIFAEIVIIYWYFYENKKTFEEINQGFRESVQEQMKSERMKVDLVTNVSHDLKTPLTSIISYVDLLSKEELTESARDYVNILADKSGRLKNIVSDLFDLAKSTSGNLPLDMENLDLRKLIEQTLGDMEDDIEKSDIRIKTSLTETPVFIYSDGKKLYRVFQNIIGNALKYSLSGTRVFIDMEMIDNKNVYVIVKNTASYDMDFTAEDVLQRFTRGDESRASEGSGLGLSIAESFTWACGGRFRVEIDGDQFKVRLEFPVIE